MLTHVKHSTAAVCAVFEPVCSSGAVAPRKAAKELGTLTDVRVDSCRIIFDVGGCIKFAVPPAEQCSRGIRSFRTETVQQYLDLQMIIWSGSAQPSSAS